MFTLRLWDEWVSDGSQGRHSEWRGKVQYVATGETHYFRDWAALQDLLLRMLPQFEDHQPGNSQE
jgi:hypothetical protein